MNWKGAIREYRTWLKVEKGLSENTFANYTHDLERYRWYMEEQKGFSTPASVGSNDIRDFIHFLAKTNHKS